MALRQISFPPSSNIADIQWDDETLQLYIQFQKGGGAVYRYDQVPENVVNGFSRALSATKYLQSFIEPSFIPVRVG